MLEQELHEYIDYLKANGNRSQKTIWGYTYHLKKLLIFLKHNNIKSFTAITPELVKAFKIDIEAKLSKKTAATLFPILRRFYEYLQDQKLIVDNPFYLLYEKNINFNWNKLTGYVLVEEYLEKRKKAGYNNSSIKTERVFFNNFCFYLYSNNIHSLYDLKIKTVHDFLNSLKGKKLSKEYINRTRRHTSGLYDYLIKKGKINKNPFKYFQPDLKTLDPDKLPDDLKNYYKEYLLKIRTENRSKHSIGDIVASLKIFFEYLVKEEITRLEDLKKDDLKYFIEYLLDLKDKKGDNRFKPISINVRLVRLKAFFKWLSQEKKICTHLNVNHLKLKTHKGIGKNILTRKEIKNLFSIKDETIYDFMMKTIFVVLYATGTRIGEILKLTIDDIDFEKGTLYIVEEKTQQERFVHVGEVGLKYLEIYLTHARDKITSNTNNTRLVFLSNYEGKPLNQTSVNKYLQIFCKRCGIKKTISSHCFRHSYGTHLLENGADIKHVSELLGHSNLSITERYTRLNPQYLREVINKFHPREIGVN